MRVLRSQLIPILDKNVVEIKFLRRHPLLNSTHRRMLCTNDKKLLQSIPARIALNYRIPTGQLPYNPSDYNLVCTWDIFMQNFRMISCDDVDVISTIPTKDPEKFWDYFNNRLSLMTTIEKISFMLN